MSITANTPSALYDVLNTIHDLIDMGMPVFSARLIGGDPRPPKGWQYSEPKHSVVDTWRPESGRALCGVTGIVFDVIDIDPRNGGLQALKKLNADIGDQGPDVYWEVATPSGGAHLYIAPLGIGKHQSFLPGIDLQGGSPDGSSRGFVYLPPTSRPSRVTGKFRQYRAVRPLQEPGEPSKTFRAYVQNQLAAKLNSRKPGGTATTSQRPARETLRSACLKAEAGDQRTALLRYVHELERIGYAPDDIIELLKVLVSDMPAYNREPWYPARTGGRDRHLRSLLHKPGEVIADADDDELKMLSPRVAANGLTSYAETEEKLVKWVWPGYLVVGDITIIDADEGVGKSLITVDVAARHSRGLPMPACPMAIVPKGNVLFLAPEDRPEVARMRLQAAGAELRTVFRPQLVMKGKGSARKAHLGSQILTFPEGVPQLRKWIEDYEIDLLVIDPITAFLSEKINSHNDASVRRALEPLSVVLGEAECAAIMIRHLNKDKKQDVRLRGTGSRAFSAVARVHLYANELPPDVGVQATHGLAMLKNSHRKRIEEVLTYSICDSQIPADDQGNMVPFITWHGMADVSAWRLAADGGARRGPEAVAQEEIAEMLDAMFGIKSDWSADDALAELRAGLGAVNEGTVKKVRQRVGIRSYAVWKPSGGVAEWRWTTEKQRVGRRRG